MGEPFLVMFLLNLAGAVGLLIWAVRLVRTGVERGFSNPLQKWLRYSAKHRLLAVFSGVGTALALQSATAVALLAASFSAKGVLNPASGLAMLLGADIGSALAAQLLLLKQSFFIPLLLVLGVTLFLRNKTGLYRQTGRIFIGLALIFVSLDMLRSATDPLLSNPSTQLVMQYLSQDLLTAFLIGAVFTWVVHSSVASVLLFVTLAAQSILPLMPASVMILGANLGGAFIAYTLMLSSPLDARKIAIANFILRGSGAILMAILIASYPDILKMLGHETARQTINLHLSFNLLLATLALPVIGPCLRMLDFVMARTSNEDKSSQVKSVLDRSLLDHPQRALGCSARELLNMGHRIEAMFSTSTGLYERWSPEEADHLYKQDAEIENMHLELKLYLASLSEKVLSKDMARRSMELASLSGHLEAASDSIARVMVPLASRLNTEGVSFSEEGLAEITEFAERIANNVKMALDVMMNQNPEEARELILAKEKIRKIEQKLQKKHLVRLQKGLAESIETSNIHQETLRALKQVNTSFSMIGYPILARSGDLLKSRLA